MANGASGSPFVMSTRAQIRGRSAGFGRAEVGHINSPPADAISRLPSRSNTSMCAPRPASTAASASQACAAVTGLPRKMPRAISATAVRRVSDHASRPAACQSRSWSRVSSTISQQNRLSTASAPIQRAAGESTWTTTRSRARSPGAKCTCDSLTAKGYAR